jgi:hypothetical protein
MDEHTLRELITEYGIPLNVKKPWWFGNYYFRAEFLFQSGLVKGTIIRRGSEQRRRYLSGDEIMKLVDADPAKAHVKNSIQEGSDNSSKTEFGISSRTKVRSSASTEAVKNPNDLDVDKNHYISGTTTLFSISSGTITPVIFDRFAEVNGQTRIYVTIQDEERASFFPFPQTKFLFSSRDDAQRRIDKEFGVKKIEIDAPASDRMIAAFNLKPAARRPASNKSIELSFEKEYLRHVDDKLQSKIATHQEIYDDAMRYRQDVAEGLREDIAAAREGGGTADDYTYISFQIKNQRVNNEIDSAQNAINKIGRLRLKPYFARIDCGASMKNLHTVYLGDEDIGDYVVSWKNPYYGNAYYQSKVVQDKSDIVLALKRIFDISHGRLADFSDEIDAYSCTGTEIQEKTVAVKRATDELFEHLLEESRADKATHDIIKTIQSEQYNIITSDFAQNLVVSGCAGSGKTMIMYHRLSYMAYNYITQFNRKFNPDLVYIVSPSDFFDDCNDELMVKLAINTVHHAPFRSQVESLIDKYCVKNGIIPFYGISEYMDTAGADSQASSVPLDFNAFYDRLQSVENSDFSFRQWVLSLANSILVNQGFKPLELDDIPIYKSQVNTLFTTTDYYNNQCFLKEGSSSYHLKYAVTDISIENIIESFDKTSSARAQKENTIKKSLGLLKCCLALKPIKDTASNVWSDIPNFWALVASPSVYNKMLSIIVAEKLLEAIALKKADSKKADSHGTNSEETDRKKAEEEKENVISPNLAYILRCLWVYKTTLAEKHPGLVSLYVLRALSEKYKAIVDEPSLIFVDEFQNYSSFEIQCLKSAFRKPVFNLFGDYNQRIEEKGSDLKSALKTLLSPTSYNLTVNYRNAKSITEYVNSKLHKNMKSIGAKGSVIETTLNQCRFKIVNRTAVICRNTDLTEKYLKQHVDISSINNLTKTNKLLKDKYVLLTVAGSRGLEFDTVYVFDYGMSKNEKYVAYTRALDTLVVISDDLGLLDKAEKKITTKGTEEKTGEKEQMPPAYDSVQENVVAETALAGKLSDSTIQLRQNHAVETVSEKSNTSSEHELDQLFDELMALNKRQEDEIKELQARCIDSEKRAEDARLSELALKGRIYSLAKDSARSKSISQLSEAVSLFETLDDFKDSREMIALVISKINAEQQAQKERRREQNLCQYCGGRFDNFLSKRCSVCGKKKDY